MLEVCRVEQRAVFTTGLGDKRGIGLMIDAVTGMVGVFAGRSHAIREWKCG